VRKAQISFLDDERNGDDHGRTLRRRDRNDECPPRVLLMAIKTKSRVSVTIEHLPGNGKGGDVLQVGSDLWNAVSPSSARNGPIAVSVGLLQTHADNGRSDPSISLSVTCWAVPGEDIQVRSYMNYEDAVHSAFPDSHARCTFRLSEAMPSHTWSWLRFSPLRKDAHALCGPGHPIARGIRASTL
jgi:hypothetical protein